ncbi:hypothetical protein AAVH_12169 [Aphelenchoides avenae]|nr:hypothetical protein AAVH_12169 [Aphelenchus avenae]
MSGHKSTLVYETGSPRGYDELGCSIPSDQKDARNKAWHNQTLTWQAMVRTDGGTHAFKSVPSAFELAKHPLKDAIPSPHVPDWGGANPWALLGLGAATSTLAYLAMKTIRVLH